MRMRSRTLVTVALAAMLTTTGCLGLFGDDEEEDDVGSTSVNTSIGAGTQADIEARANAQFQNYTVPGQEELPTVTKWFNGTVGPGEGVPSIEDRNDRSGLNYNTPIVSNDISGDVPPGQPAVIRAKVWYFAQPGSGTDLDIYANVPGLETEFATDNCDEFSWKVCVQEMTIPTVGSDDHPMEIGVQIANSKTVDSLDYMMEVKIDYVADVVTPYTPYAVEMPENATGLVVTSEKAGGSEHIDAEFLVVGPDDQLVEHVEYNDIAIATESKRIPVSQPGEYVVYILDIQGGFLGVEADVPVPAEQREIRPLERVEETVTDASSPAPGTGGYCVPAAGGDGCTTELTYNEGGSTDFAVNGTFPLEIRGWINEEAQPSAHANSEVRILSEEGLVYKQDKFMQYEDDRGTLGMSRDEWHTNHTWENLATGEYTVSYVIDGSGSVGHTLVTYERGG